MGGWTYILTNRPNGVLYIGVTASLPARMMQHRAGSGSEFCRRYGIKQLVLVEPHSDMTTAIAREKAWKRAWKIELIEKANSGWRDLYEVLLG